MKKWMGILMCGILLAGCSAQPVMETIGDVLDQPAMAPVQQVLLQLPEDVSAPAMESDAGEVFYQCDGYTLMLQTLPSGDLNRSIAAATGYEKEDLQLIQTHRDNAVCYQGVFVSAGEKGEQMGRLCLLDDGAYHYVLTAMAEAEEAGKLQEAWNELFTSFRLTETKEDVNTGS